MYVFEMAAYMRVCLSCFYVNKKTQTIQNAHLSFSKHQISVHRCVRADERADRQTDTVLIGRSITPNRLCNVLEFNPCKKLKACGAECVKKDGKIEPKHLFQFPAQPSPFLGLVENTTFAHLSKKSKYLKAIFCIYHQILF